jgi:hypothetical protein
MSGFTKDHAEKFSKKLNSKPKDDSLPRLQVVVHVDNAHSQQQIWCGDKFIAAFGIKHGSKRNASHGWVARELSLQPRFAVEFANCSVSIDKMIDVMIEKGWIEGLETKDPKSSSENP